MSGILGRFILPTDIMEPRTAIEICLSYKSLSRTGSPERSRQAADSRKTGKKIDNAIGAD
jgi:hypothetical protein